MTTTQAGSYYKTNRQEIHAFRKSELFYKTKTAR